MNRTQRIVANLAYLFVGEGISVILAFVATIWLARHLTDEGFGRLAFAQSLIMYLAILCDLGLAVYGAREIARDKIQAKRIGINILVIRSSLAFLLVSLLAIVLLFIDISLEMKILLWGSSLALFTQALNPEFIFQGLERMAGIAVWRILIHLLYIIPILIYVNDRQDLALVPFFRFAAEIVAVIITAALLRKMLGEFTLALIECKIWKYFLKESIVIAFSVSIVRTYSLFDTFMLGILDRPEAVGWYQAGLKIVQLLVAAASILQLSFVPTIASNASDPSRLDIVISRFGMLLTSIGGMACGIIFLLDKFIMSTLYGQGYIRGAAPLAILCISAFMTYMATAFNAAIIFGGRQKDFLKMTIISGIVCISLNAILIPLLSYIGAAWANFACNFALLVAGLYYYRKMGSLQRTFRPMFILASIAFLLVAAIRLLALEQIQAAIIFALAYAAAIAFYYKKYYSIKYQGI